MKISVIIPSINAEKSRRTLESVLCQNGVSADEIIIAGRNLAGFSAVGDDRVRIVNEHAWMNAATARNKAAALAKGDILLFIDDDCLAASDWIYSNLEALFGSTEPAAVLGRLLGKSGRYFARCADLSGFWVQQNAIERYVGLGYAASLGIKRGLFESIGGFDPAKDMVEDCDLYERLRAKGHKILYDPKVVVYHDHGKDTFFKMISFMYEGGVNYRRYFSQDIGPKNFIINTVSAAIRAFLNALQSFRLNRGVYPAQYMYIPGVILGFLAWHLGLAAKPEMRKSLKSLIFFVTGECNLRCEHCFYHDRLNKKDDIKLEQIKKAFKSFGKIENLLLSGGEPFLREDLLEICCFFKENNGVKSISIPTNGSLPEITRQKTQQLLERLNIPLTVGISLDGMKDYHDALRGKPGAFDSALKTYEALKPLKNIYPGFMMTVNPVATARNTAEILKLAGFVKERMPGVDHFWLSVVRGDTRSKDETAADTATLSRVYKEANDIFYCKSKGVVPAKNIWDKVFSIKMDTINKKRQIVACCAGESIGVLDSNGDARACELREPFGNIKDRDFLDIWNSYLADLMRKSIRNKDCYCTHECFIYPSAMKSAIMFPVIILFKIKGLISYYGRR